MLRSSLTDESDIAVNDPRIPEVIRALHRVAIELVGSMPSLCVQAPRPSIT